MATNTIDMIITAFSAVLNLAQSLLCIFAYMLLCLILSIYINGIVSNLHHLLIYGHNRNLSVSILFNPKMVC